MNLFFCSMDCGFFNAFYVSVKFLILFMYCVPNFIELSFCVFCGFPQTAIFNSLSGKLKISMCLKSVTGKLFCLFGGITFP